MSSDDLPELLRYVLLSLGAEAGAIAVLMPDGTATGLHMVYHSSEEPPPKVLRDLAKTLQHCAGRAEESAERVEQTYS